MIVIKISTLNYYTIFKMIKKFTLKSFQSQYMQIINLLNIAYYLHQIINR